MLYVVRFRYVLCGFNCENLNGRGGFTTLLYTNNEERINFGCIIAPAVRKVRIRWVFGILLSFVYLDSEMFKHGRLIVPAVRIVVYMVAQQWCSCLPYE